jgi:hypothetical protein
LKKRELPADTWIQRKFWLTSGGGFFTYSPEAGEAVGIPVTTLVARALEEDHPDRIHGFTFELTAQADAAKGTKVTLAAESRQERDQWLQKLGQAATGEGAAFSPSGIFQAAGIRSDRRRRTGHLEAYRSSRSPRSPKSPGIHGFSKSGKKDSPQGSPKSGNTKSEASIELAESTLPERQTSAVAPPSVPKRNSKRYDSQITWNEKSSTTIILDFDDTIFPTTWIKEDLGLNWRQSLDEQEDLSEAEYEEIAALLERLTQRVREFLKLASKHAQVVCVTLAQKPWVDTACNHFMPKLLLTFRELAIPVIYARDYITPEMKKKYQEKDFRTAGEEAEFWMRAKAGAMQDTFSKHYDEKDRTWKNIISIGDSTIEQTGLVYAGEEYVNQLGDENGRTMLSKGRTSELLVNGQRKRLRVKTLKMLEEPTCDELLAQMVLFAKWISPIVNRDEGLDLVVSGSDDNEVLNQLHKQVTGEDVELDWMELAEE